jgi:hypothetical protein
LGTILSRAGKDEPCVSIQVDGKYIIAFWLVPFVNNSPIESDPFVGPYNLFTIARLPGYSKEVNVREAFGGGFLGFSHFAGKARGAR